MAIDKNGEWVDDEVDGAGIADGDYGPYSHDFDPTHGDNSGGGVILDTKPADNADDHGEIKQPESTPRPTGGGGKSEEDMKKELGDLYTPGAYEEYQHHDYDPGWYDRIVNKENLRRDNTPGSEYHEDGKGGYLTPPKAAGSSKLLGGMSGGGSGSGGSSSGSGKMDDVYGYLKGLFPGGGFNQDVVNRRLDSVRGNLEGARKSALKNNEAYLAERGLIGSGPQADASESLTSRLFGQFGSAYNDIYSKESENADNRMIAALQAATGMSEHEAQNQIEWFRAQSDNALGFGNLAARNKESDISKLLGSGNLDVARQNAATGSYSAQMSYDIATKNLELARREYDEAVRNHDMEAADRAQQRINELEQIRAAGTHK